MIGDRYFLPYQVAWIQDRSRFKLAEKSRRVGLTYAQSYEDVRDAAEGGGVDVWFSSADESAAKEYIHYCGQWARILNIGARELGEVVIDKDDDIKALVVELANGRRIHGLSSNPKAFRSKGGKLVLDEFAFHADQEGMWRAARPIITWGYPVRIISTLNGRGNLYYRLLDEAKKAASEGRKPLWSLHTIPITRAVDEGLADKISGRELNDQERANWMEAERQSCGSEDVWQQEYLCQPLDSSTAWLSYDLITRAEHPDAGDPEKYLGGDVYVGYDIARRRDLPIVWVCERMGDVLWTREVITMRGATFAAQMDAVRGVFDRYKVRRLCADQSGMGEPIVEELKRRHGAYLVEGVLFTGPVKHELATTTRQAFEDARVRMPGSPVLRDAHHAVRCVVTAAGNPRFDAERTDAGHADEFWAHALAIHAAGMRRQPAAGETIGSDGSEYAPEHYGPAERPGVFGRLRRSLSLWGRPSRGDDTEEGSRARQGTPGHALDTIEAEEDA